MLATVRAEVLDLRRDLTGVLTNLFVALSRPPEEAKRLISQTPNAAPVIIEDEEAAQVEKLRGEMLDLRRDVAVVMANLLIATGRSPEEVKKIVLSPLAPRNSE